MLNQASLLATTNATNHVFTVLLATVAAISLLVGGIGVMNIMLVTVTERTREIGIRKAIGARRIDILGQFLSEAALISVLGGVLGVLFGLIGSRFKIVGVQPAVQVYAVALAFSVGVAVGVFFGFYPANRAAALRPDRRSALRIAIPQGELPMQPEIHPTEAHAAAAAQRPAAGSAPQGRPARDGDPRRRPAGRRHLPGGHRGPEAVGRQQLGQRRLRRPRRRLRRSTGTATGGTNGGAQAAPGAGGGLFRRGGGGFTTGKVKLVQGSTIYVTTTDGNTVKVSVPSSTAITKSVTTKLSGVHPGDNVTAIGTASSDGVIKATSVRLGDTGFPGFGGRRAGGPGGGFGQNGNGGAQGTNGG